MTRTSGERGAPILIPRLKDAYGRCGIRCWLRTHPNPIIDDGLPSEAEMNDSVVLKLVDRLLFSGGQCLFGLVGDRRAGSRLFYMFLRFR